MSKLLLIFCLISVVFLFGSFTNKEIIKSATSESNKGDFVKSNSILLNSKSPSSEINYLLSENYYYLNKIDSSIYFLTKLLSKSEKTNSIHAKSYSLLGTCYSYNQQYDLAILSIRKSIEIRKKYNDQRGIGKCYNNLGDVYYVSKNPKKALQYFLKANAILKSTRDLNLQINLSNIGAAYIDLNQLNMALPYINQAINLAKELNDELGQSICVNNLATIYRDLGATEKALFYYLQALELAKKMDSKGELKTIFYNLSVLSEKQKNFTKALHFHKEYTRIKDEIFNTEKNEFIVETQEKYDATERKREIAELKVSKQQKEAENFKMQVGIIISIILLVFISLTIYLRLRSKRREEESKNKLAIISATMEAEENERKTISQNLHDDLGGLLGISRMLFTKTKKYIQDQNPELYNRIDDLLLQANNKSRAISHELYSPTLRQFGLQAAIKEYIQHIESLHPDLQIIFKMDNFRLDTQREINTFRIVQELFNNTLKYANATKISLTIILEEKSFKFNYSDNGIGFNDETLKKGIGLNSITDRVHRFHGNITITSQLNKGFQLIFTIPNPSI